MKEITLPLDSKCTGVKVGDYQILDGVKQVVTGFIESKDGEIRLATFRDVRSIN